MREDICSDEVDIVDSWWRLVSIIIALMRVAQALFLGREFAFQLFGQAAKIANFLQVV